MTRWLIAVLGALVLMFLAVGGVSLLTVRDTGLDPSTSCDLAPRNEPSLPEDEVYAIVERSDTLGEILRGIERDSQLGGTCSDCDGWATQTPANLPELQPWQFGPVRDHDNCGPLELPVPEYPMIHQPLEADCDVSFLIDDEGRPFEIQAQCSENAFERASKRAIAKMRWRITNEDGERCNYIGRTDIRITYPLEYRLK